MSVVRQTSAAELPLKPGFGGVTADHATGTDGAKQKGLSV
jgi:hypothetical protein